jgi:mannosylglycoprotein endo-beta-mannosidase
MLCRKCSDDDGKVVAQVLNIENTSFDDKYLGLPIPEGHMKNDKFQPSKEKLKKKCSDWSEKYMSGAAKETLVKSVAQSISTYAMSVFKFSAGLCDELSQIIRDFWWGDEFDRRKVHWMGWDKMTRPKSQGGLALET